MSNDRVLEPFMPKNPVMIAAWLGGLRFALSDKDAMATFRAETGNNWTPAKNGFDQMIDEATGANADFFVQFAKWYNANMWGEDSEGAPFDVGVDE